MKTKKIILVFITISAFLLTSCYSHNWETRNPVPAVTKPCTLPDTVSYSKDIVPILNASCSLNNSSCHSSAHGSSGGDMTTYTSLTENFCNGDSTNQIYLAITWSPPYTSSGMPQTGNRLSQCDINQIIRWLVQGKKNN